MMTLLPPSSLLCHYADEARIVGLGVQQEPVNKGVRDLADPQEPGVGRPKRHRRPMDHSRAMGLAIKAAATPAVRLHWD